eukprot:5638736-Lingulodinium_polyedra.AAC.1
MSHVLLHVASIVSMRQCTSLHNDHGLVTVLVTSNTMILNMEALMIVVVTMRCQRNVPDMWALSIL